MKLKTELVAKRGQLAGITLPVGTAITSLARVVHTVHLEFAGHAGKVAMLPAYRVKQFVDSPPDEFVDWPGRLTGDEFAKERGYDTFTAWQDSEEFVGLIMDSVCPTLCAEGCEVEPDGTCQHGHPSILKAMGVI